MIIISINGDYMSSSIIELNKLTWQEAFNELQERLGPKADIEKSDLYCCANSGYPLVVKFSNVREYFCRCGNSEGKFQRIWLDGHSHMCK